MYQIELIGSYTTATTLSGEEIRITTQRKDPVPVLCRKLISLGADPQATAHVSRGEMKVWKKDRTLASWAGIDVVDEDRDGLRVRPYKAFPSTAVGAKKEATANA
jgi:hypothetical protein